jgi:predicted transcriptional regulator
MDDWGKFVPCPKQNWGDNPIMSAAEVIAQIKELPADERAQVAKFVVENDDSWIPESFKRGMADAAAGRFADMETVLSGAPPPSRKRRK